MKNEIKFAMWIFLFGTLLACVASGRWLINGEVNIINALASFNVMSVETGGGWGLPKAVLDFFSAIVTALGWRYPFLDAPFALIIKFPLWIVSVGVIVGITQVATQAMNGFVGVARSIIRPI